MVGAANGQTKKEEKSLAGQISETFLTLSCCWSSLFNRASTAFASLFLRIAV